MDETMRLVMNLLLRFEGLRLKPYLCPAGVPTIALGVTHYLDGHRVTLSDSALSTEAAMRLSRLTVEREFLPQVRALCPAADTPERLAALTDFAFNLGLGALKTSTLRKRVNARDWAGARAELGKWVKGGGRVLPGLVARRAAEAILMRDIG